MKILCISSQLETILSLKYSNYYFEYQCGNGFPLTTSLNNPSNNPSSSNPSNNPSNHSNKSSQHLIKLPIITSSPSLINLTIKLFYYDNLFNSYLLCSKNIKLKDLILNNLQTLEIKMDLNENFNNNENEDLTLLSSIIISTSYQMITSSCIELLELLTNGITINTLINFIDIPREDISLRILNEKGTCLALSNIKQQQSSSYFIFNPLVTNLEISIASKSTGVIQMPFEINTPMVLKLEGYPTGYILLCINSTHGHKKEIERTRTLLLDTISYYSSTAAAATNSVTDDIHSHQLKDSLPSSPLTSLSSTPKEKINEIINLPSNIIYHIQNLLLEGDEDISPNPTLLSSGIVYGPLISRLEIPKFSPSFLLNSFYSLPYGQNEHDITSLTKEIHHLPSNFRGILITENEYLSTKIKLRLSFLRTHDSITGSMATTSSIESNAIQEGPCGLYLASGVLREIDRTSHSLPESIKHPHGQVDLESDSIKCLFTCYLEGTLDHISQDIPNNFFHIGEKITCHVVIYSSNVQQEKITIPELKNNIEDTIDDFLPSVSILSHLSTSPEIVEDNFHDTHSIQSSSVMSISDTESQLESQSQSQRRNTNTNTHNLHNGPGNDIIQILTNQLYEKQRIIDRLLDEGTMKAEIISKHGAEILVFQKEILNLKTKLTEHQAALSYREQESDEAVRLAHDGLKDPNILYQSNRQMLINAVVETSKRYNKVNQERVEYKKLISESKTIKRQFDEVQQSYLELQEANLIQSKYIDKIQKQLAKVETYQSTILMQEKVINKMQTVIENHFKTNSDEKYQKNSNILLGSQLQLSSSLPSQTQQNQQPQQVVSLDEVEKLKKKCNQLEAQIKSKDIRIESLQEQLTSSSQEAARLVASLRAKLFELELTAESSSKPSSSFLNPHSSTYNHLVPFNSSPNHFNSLENNDINSKFNSPKPNSKNQYSVGDDLFSDLAGNIYPQRGNSRDVTTTTTRSPERIGTRESQSSSSRNIPIPEKESKHDRYPKKNYLTSAYRNNSKTGSPRPNSPSEASTQATGDNISPRISKPSDSMRDLFHSSRYERNSNSNNNSNVNEQNFNEKQRKDINTDLLFPSSSLNTDISSNKPPLRVSSSQHPSLNPSPVRSPQNKPNSSSNRLPTSSRPQSNQHNTSQSPLRASSSLPSSPHHQLQQQQNLSNDVLHALLQQSTSSEISGKNHNYPISSDGGKGFDMNNNEDILDSLLKRRGINSAQRSSRSADSNR